MGDKKKHEEPLTAEVTETAEESVTESGAEIPAEPESPAKSEVELLSEKVSELSDKLLRTMAEYDNFRKRSQREREGIYPQATANAAAQFLPILDTFDRALGAPCADEEYKKGVEMLLQNFKDALAKLGVEEFGAAGDTFNPDLHNAVMHIEDEALEANIVSEVFQKGYRLGERIVRHAMVKVAN